MSKKGTSGALKPATCEKFKENLLEEINFCHESRIIHRDFNPLNLLIDSHRNLKISDSGLAISFGIPVITFSCEVVTLWYRSPAYY
ncbi:hypothetical protein CONCODRAFT_13250 [Conidiobolus coronatus NRRL 28638]|uniref:Protein kinase domain-containing protein n=1 Tax=Conidiobolus coronatus (strain ATCC 28846 / CBS 209.66 / NRRL 28638) TaxID=796925 RepID=A0A137NR73_CONC2|nr:hypothetical protein CONCODRAFT_13250 [Conidiobolus coronatus NRRL 28638]|eukprot:KXN65235.1 hypothetical protein CONCODRAFT_13250 [Conidiobolus coronatus NRRL 28638]